MEKIQVSQNSMLRNLLGVRLEDKTSLDEIYLKTRANRSGLSPEPLNLNMRDICIGRTARSGIRSLSHGSPTQEKEKEVDRKPDGQTKSGENWARHGNVKQKTDETGRV